MELHVGGRVLPLSHVGPDSVILVQPVDLPRRYAGEVRVWVDGRLVRRPVLLTHGAVNFDDVVEIEPQVTRRTVTALNLPKVIRRRFLKRTDPDRVG